MEPHPMKEDRSFAEGILQNGFNCVRTLATDIHLTCHTVATIPYLYSISTNECQILLRGISRLYHFILKPLFATFSVNLENGLHAPKQRNDFARGTVAKHWNVKIVTREFHSYFTTEVLAILHIRLRLKAIRRKEMKFSAATIIPGMEQYWNWFWEGWMSFFKE